MDGSDQGPELPGRLGFFLRVYRAFRRLSRLGLIAEFARSAWREVKSPGGQANFIGFMFVFLMLMPLIGYSVLNQFLGISLHIEVIGLTLVPTETSLVELLTVIATILVLPFLFGKCLDMFEAVHGD